MGFTRFTGSPTQEAQVFWPPRPNRRRIGRAIAMRAAGKTAKPFPACPATPFAASQVPVTLECILSVSMSTYLPGVRIIG